MSLTRRDEPCTLLLLRPAAGFTRALFVTGPGPLSGGSKGGRVKWPHIPEKFGIVSAAAAPPSVWNANAQATSEPVISFRDLMLVGRFDISGLLRCADPKRVGDSVATIA